ncbi:hypothetical protein RRG08_051767 [Elysia crispata]|uniref:Uncharacterized protein n=1 Tax=Elysia crispata TaxID=231223 RepID=A0AAE1B7W5_9GAST|nr:hypothetical protein RRG08_051767 [Elysia crispata]
MVKHLRAWSHLFTSRPVTIGISRTGQHYFTFVTFNGDIQITSENSSTQNGFYLIPDFSRGNPQRIKVSRKTQIYAENRRLVRIVYRRLEWTEEVRLEIEGELSGLPLIRLHGRGLPLGRAERAEVNTLLSTEQGSVGEMPKLSTEVDVDKTRARNMSTSVAQVYPNQISSSVGELPFYKQKNSREEKRLSTTLGETATKKTPCPEPFNYESVFALRPTNVLAVNRRKYKL